ncbi:MAG TPA: hypothetical protein VG293_06815 [Solirubrobacteraceae bacterium]|nr:hypothetical protein [Solirubrobacteraceae bacterium]
MPLRRLLVPTSAVCVALIAAACGGSGRRVATRTFTGVISSGAARVQTRTTVPPPTPAEIERAVALTATKPGFAAKVSATVKLAQLGPNAVTAVGNGFFDPRSDSGTLDLAVGLPGLLSLAGPLPTQVRLVGPQAYVQVPADIAREVGISAGWLEDSIAALGLGDTLSPPDILREVARDATRTVAGQRAHVTLDPATGLVRTIALSYAVAGGYHVRVRLTLTGFGNQTASAAPAAAQTRDLRSALKALGF